MKANSSCSSGATKGSGGPVAGTGKSFMSGLAEERRRQKRRSAALQFLGSSVRAGGNVPHDLFRTCFKSKWFLPDQGCGIR
jgi:hypothetical protein